MDTDNILELETGCSGKAHLLEIALLEVLDQERFRSMNLAEMIGTLEVVKAALLDQLD